MAEQDLREGLRVSERIRLKTLARTARETEEAEKAKAVATAATSAIDSPNRGTCVPTTIHSLKRRHSSASSNALPKRAATRHAADHGHEHDCKAEVTKQEVVAADIKSFINAQAGPVMPSCNQERTEQWVAQTIQAMQQAFMHGREHYNTPLASVFYWMPRLAPENRAATRLVNADPLTYWTIAVRDKNVPFETAPVIRYLRTDQVAHWLHISMQDLIGFMSLCDPTEAIALNDYLNFRLELMRSVQMMPFCYQWLYIGKTPQPGDPVYELLLKIRSLDDQEQKRFAWMVQFSTQRRRNPDDPACLPKRSQVRFSQRENRAMFDFLVRAWFHYRAKTSPIIEWNARDEAIPNFTDTRPLTRWFVPDDTPLENLTVDLIQQTLDSDMHLRGVIERDRTFYQNGEMVGDEMWHAFYDMRPYFPHQLPHRVRGDRMALAPYRPAGGPMVASPSYDAELREIENWYQRHFHSISTNNVQGRTLPPMPQSNFDSRPPIRPQPVLTPQPF
ncbi:hypothetical protein BCR41DRAFT_387738 [Lobosporangium transversale]|uniref:Uncharacterized protein n=1 Tax=Lobosporangium transversale TaxID=64571 RepID=A0A1Y2GHN2_9FUNG|nr:hypothetical protein BCR41DRAFT_387738 [Lobosporangium transversale]ORZ11278.1 hypothetical protein BCR41DRAFT_387738 [Lobosporangium transversale]|eukprot:XP_021879593.1 hypothetical protein BCR41DRAFT_387738 [Lobosporangium transversale]